MQNNLIEHKPALLDKVKFVYNEYVKKLNPFPQVLDLTFGSGNYSRGLLECGARLEDIKAIDCDPNVNVFNREGFDLRICKFSNVHKEFTTKFDFLMADLGTSMTQLKSGRGFSFHDQNLDMRMSCKGKTAEAFLKETNVKTLSTIFKNNNVPNHLLVARLIKEHKLYSVEKLKTLPLRFNGKTNPLTKILQALRIAVNDEINEINMLLENSLLITNPKAFMLFNTFHSGEERLFKNFISTQGSMFREEIWHTILVLKANLADIVENISVRSLKMRLLSKEIREYANLK